ncbi:MAG: YopX family protein [Bacteroidota bacterium]
MVSTDFKPRKIKFKAWDKEARLLMRLNSIECQKGELFKKDHILLQFTGLLDKEGEEIYDRDVLLIHYEKFMVFWNEEKNGWFFSSIEKPGMQEPFLGNMAEKMKRFCSYFELQGK